MKGISDNADRLAAMHGYGGDKKSNASALGGNNLKKSVFDMTEGISPNTPMYTTFQSNKIKKSKQADNIKVKSAQKIKSSASNKDLEVA